MRNHYPENKQNATIDPDKRRREFLKRKQRGNFIRHTAIPLALAGVALLGARTMIDANTLDYNYSDQTHTVVAEPGQGLESIARTVQVYGDTADLRDIAQHLEETNPGLANGLQEGEGVKVPDTVEVN